MIIYQLYDIQNTNFQPILNQITAKAGLVRDQILPRLDQWVESMTVSNPTAARFQMITIRLQPDQMGELHIRLTHTSRGLVAQFSTDSQDALGQLTADRDKLSDSLKSIGPVAKVDFSLRPTALDTMSQNQNPSSSSQGQASSLAGSLDLGGRSRSGQEGQAFNQPAAPQLPQDPARDTSRPEPDTKTTTGLCELSLHQQGGWRRIIDYRA